MNRSPLRWIPLLGALALAPSLPITAAEATVMTALSLDDMARGADVIARGEIVEQKSAWIERRIYTVTRLKITESLKGSHKAGDVISIRQLGGTVDGISQQIAGNARLAVGEEVALFLKSDPEKDLHYVMGMAQGKYAIDRSSGAPRAVRQLSGLSLSRPGVRKLAKAHEIAERGTPWPDLKAQIRGALQAPAATPAPAP